MTPEELLSHDGFIRSLSRRLVLDENLADEMVQETWLISVKKPPETDTNPKSWLSMTLRNLVRMWFRTEGRRKKREEAVAVPEPLPSTADLAAREEIKAMVAQAVSGLKEPYRTTLLLHYFKSMTYKEMAKQLDIPLETVRTRMKRGLAQLREQLDRKYSGNRDDWILALAPVAGLHPGWKDGGKVVGSAAGISGLFAWFMSLKVWQAAALLLAGAALVSLLIKEEVEIPPPAEQDLVARGDTEPKASEMPAPVLLEEEKKLDNEREVVAPADAPPSTAAPRLVTWRGTLIDHDGMPLGNLFLQIKRNTPESTYISAKLDETGTFEFKDLEPGEYAVEMYVPPYWEGWYRKVFQEWGEVQLNEPGIVNHDIFISRGKGAFVLGTVVHEETGEPVLGPGISVQVTWQSDIQSLIFSPVDEDTGHFCIRCLPPGTYNLALGGPGLNIGLFRDLFEVSEGDVIDDLRIPVPPMGELLMTLDGFEDEKTLTDLNFKFYQKQCQPSGYPVNSTDMKALLRAGEMAVKLVHPDLGYTVKKATIRSNETTRLQFNRSDLSPEKDHMTIKGRYMKENGDPVPEALLCFSPPDIKSLSQRHMLRWVWTEKDGSFESGGFHPGYWVVLAHFFSPEHAADLKLNKDIPSLQVFPLPAKTVYAKTFVVTSESPNPFCQELTMHSGEVKGVLCDATTGAPFSDLDWKFFAYVTQYDDLVMMREWIYQGFKDNIFHVIGLPEGKYILTLNAPGFMRHTFKPFFLSHGEKLDLGNIPLFPSGLLDLKVFDSHGKANIDFAVEYAGAPAGRDPIIMHPLPNNGTRLSGIPPETVTLRISISDHRPKYLTVDLKPRTPVTAEVTFQPKDRVKRQIP